MKSRNKRKDWYHCFSLSDGLPSIIVGIYFLQEAGSHTSSSSPPQLKYQSIFVWIWTNSFDLGLLQGSSQVEISFTIPHPHISSIAYIQSSVEVFCSQLQEHSTGIEISHKNLPLNAELSPSKTQIKPTLTKRLQTNHNSCFIPLRLP